MFCSFTVRFDKHVRYTSRTMTDRARTSSRHNSLQLSVVGKLTDIYSWQLTNFKQFSYHIRGNGVNDGYKLRYIRTSVEAYRILSHCNTQYRVLSSSDFNNDNLFKSKYWVIVKQSIENLVAVTVTMKFYSNHNTESL